MKKIEVILSTFYIESNVYSSDTIDLYKESRINKTTLATRSHKKLYCLDVEKIQNLEKPKSILCNWLEAIENLKLKDFSEYDKTKDSFHKTLSTHSLKEWNGILEQIDYEVAKYTDYYRQRDTNIKQISNESIKTLLHLIPIFSNYRPNVAIDADTGYFTANFNSSDHGIMTVLITPKGDLHYSLAERGIRLVKISGTAKIKDPNDLKKFNKVLLML